jgi:hypothetical protein
MIYVVVNVGFGDGLKNKMQFGALSTGRPTSAANVAVRIDARLCGISRTAGASRLNKK